MAVIAQPICVVGWLVPALWQGPRYSTIDHSVSDMLAVSAPHPEFLMIVLALYGAVVIVFAAVSLRSSLLAGGWRATAGAILLSLSFFGLSELLAPFERFACRAADPGCTLDVQVSNFGGRLDEIMSVIGIVMSVAAGFVLAAAMKRTPGWGRGAWPARWATILLAVLFVVDIVVGFGSGPGVGLFERLAFVVGHIGIAAMAIGVLRTST